MWAPGSRGDTGMIWDGGQWVMPQDWAKTQAAQNTGGGNQISPEQLASMNAQTQGYKDQTAALQAQVAAQNAATAAGPQIQYNPLNDDGTLKDTFKLNSADSYAKALQQQQDLMGAQGRDTASQQAQTAAQQAENNLAMRGGIGGENRALLESQALKQGLAGQQQASQTAQNNNANIGVQAANAQMGIDKANLGTQLTAAQNVNAFDLDKYNQNMAVKAADSQAKATEAASNQGGKK